MRKLIKYINKNERGIGLVEMILALGVAIIVITAMVSLSVYTLRSSTQGEILFEASKYANEYLERVRLRRDQSASWAAFRTAVSSCGTSCTIQDTGAITPGTDPITGTTPPVTRYFRATKVDGTAIDATTTVVRISVDVSWSLGGVAKHTYVYTDLSNWRKK